MAMNRENTTTMGVLIIESPREVNSAGTYSTSSRNAFWKLAKPLNTRVKFCTFVTREKASWMEEINGYKKNRQKPMTQGKVKI